MKHKVLLSSCILALSTLIGCAGSSAKNGEDLEVPTDLPPICRDIQHFFGLRFDLTGMIFFND